MTNKKLKLAAMSVALTACVAAQPMAAHAVEGPDSVEDNAAPQAEPVVENSTPAPVAEEGEKQEEVGEQEEFVPPVNEEAKSEEQAPAFGPGTKTGDIIIDYKPAEKPEEPGKSGEDGEADGSEGSGETGETENPDGTYVKGDVIDNSKKDEATGKDGKIGEATKEETPDSSSSTTVVDPDAEVKKGDPVVGKDEDGNTTITTKTETTGTQTTTTTGTGEAKSETTITDTKKGEEINLDDELGKDMRPDWKTDKDATLGDYTVKEVEPSEDGNSKTLTLKKTSKPETKEMSAEDVAKLLDVPEGGVEKKEELDEEGNPKTTYTLKKEETSTDENGNTVTRTTYYEITGNTVKTRTETTLVLKVEKGTAEGGKDLTTEVKLPSIKNSNDKEILSAEELGDLLKDQTAIDGVYTVKREKNGKTYIYKITEAKSSDTLTPEQIADRLKSEGYKYENGKFYYNGIELNDVQINAVRKTLSYTVEVTEETKNPGQIEEGKDVSEIEKNAKLEAIRTALIEAAKKAGLDTSEADFNTKLAAITSTDKGEFIYTDANNKSYTFNYDGATVDTVHTPTGDTKVDGKDAENVLDNTVTGTAYVTSGTKSWGDSDSYSNTVNGELADGISSDFTIPEGATQKKDETINGVRTVVYEYNGKTYTLTYTTPDVDQLAKIKADLEKKLRDEGKTSDEISAIISNEQFQWVSWTVTHTESKSKTETDTTEVDLSETNWSISDKEAASGVTIKVNDVTYDNLSTKDGKTYTGKKGDKYYTITIGETEAIKDASVIERLLKSKYGENFTYNVDLSKGTATYWDADGHEHTIKYVNAEATSITVSIREETEHGSVSGSATTEAEAERKLMEAIEAARKEADKEGYDLVIGDTVIKPGTTFEEIKHVLESVNYGTLTGQDLIDYLNKAKQDANAGATEKEKDAYTGNEYQDSWGDKNNLTNKNTIGHLDLGTSSKLTTIDGKEVDCVLVKKNLYWNESAEDLVGEGKNNHEVGLIDRITFDNEEGRGNGHYEYPRASWDNYDKYWNPDTKTWDTRKIDGYPTTSQFYKVTGTIAYGLYEDKNNRTGSKYYNRTTADRKLKELQKKYPDAQIVQIYNGQDKDSSSYYQIYLYQSEMTSYGYLSKSNNNCANKTFGYNDGFYDYDWWGYVKPGSSNIGYIGGYDLTLSNLTQISKEKVTGQQTFDYKANLSYRKRRGEDISAANNTLRVTSDSYDYKEPCTVTDSVGSGYNGTYDVSFKQSFDWKKDGSDGVEGTGSGKYKSFTEIIRNIFKGSGSSTNDEGKFSYTYRTEDKVKASAVSKTTETTTKAHVDYNFTTVETKKVPVYGEETVVIPPVTPPVTPEDPDVPPVQDETVVTPETPELPPVQDATPDQVIAPANPELPPVQDATALPQTGVNWMAALGMAFSGMLLTIAGAFASLKYKEKH